MTTTNIDETNHERLMREKAIFTHEVRKREAMASGRAGTVAPFKGLIAVMQHSAAAKVGLLLQKRTKSDFAGVHGLRQSKVSVRVATAIATRTIVDGLVQAWPLQKLSRQVGARIEDEARVNELKKREPLLWKNVQLQLKERGSQDYTAKRRAVHSALMKANSEEQWTPWTMRERATVGLVMIDALVQAGFCETKYVPVKARYKKQIELQLTAEAERALIGADEQTYDLLRPWFKPMVQPPLDWTTPTDGGYLEIESSLVKLYRRQEIERFNNEDMPAVYKAVNAVQRTPWRVNEDVLVVAEEVWDRSIPVAGVPTHEEIQAPIRPADIPPPKSGDLTDEQTERLHVWLTQKRQWHNETARRKSRRMQAFQTMAVAKELRKELRIYFPHNLDYRGRMYPIPLALQPQGNDFSKGLLQFGTGFPLGKMGAYWLAVHGANTFGFDKGALNDRVDWVCEHEEAILRVGDDPLSEMWWTEADAPWQFLAWCLEYAQVIESDFDPEFVSYLHVDLDGACNGIQHFSAMLRDQGGATATNMTSDPTQHDVYQEVADEVTALLVKEHETPTSAETRQLAAIWLAFGIKRDVVKRPVMTTPYGASMIGMKQMVLEDTIDKNRDAYFGDRNHRAAQYLATIIHQAIGSKLKASRDAMVFLQQSVALLAANGTPLAWTSPAGFPVLQKAMSRTHFIVKTNLLGKIQLRFSETLATMDRKKQRNAVAPNFVHSYDAAHMMLTVGAMEDELRESVSWAMVHDSYGTHAGRVQKLGEVLREQFVLLYSAEDPLATIAEYVALNAPEGSDLPPMPESGTFNLFEVLEAEFFFA